MTVELVQSSSSNSVAMRSFAEIVAAIKIFFRGGRPTSAGSCIENAGGETEAVIRAQIVTPPQIEADAGIGLVAHDKPNQQEIERRRNLVRTLFNDFWSGEEQKPASFTTRLDQSEDYLNQRLAANGETWRLDTETRGMLNLPPRSSSSA